MASSKVIRVRSDGFSNSKVMYRPARAWAKPRGTRLHLLSEVQQRKQLILRDIQIASEIASRDSGKRFGRWHPLDRFEGSDGRHGHSLSAQRLNVYSLL